MNGTGSLQRLRKPAAKIARILLRRERAGREYTPFPDDICVVSYPKSGGTWLRFLIGNLIRPETPVTFANIESAAPSIYHNPDHRLRQAPRPRVLKSHESFFSRHGRVIYIVRDPRDIAVSYYYYLVKFRELPQGYPMVEYVPRFMREDFDAKYGPWDDHVLSWIRMRQGDPQFLLLRYEDLLGNPKQGLERIASFIGVEVDERRVQQAIELSSADRMRKLEKKQSRTWSATSKSRQDMPFVRAATAGNWGELPRESVQLIESAWAPLMQSLGYALSGELRGESGSYAGKGNVIATQTG